MDRSRKASLCLLAGGGLWGLYWIPLSRIETAGLPPGAAAPAVFLPALLLCLPVGIIRRRALAARAADLAVAGLFTGGALGLFTAALGRTDVVHAILLFYLTPIWSTLIGLAVLGERLTRIRVLTLGLGLFGMVVILGTGGRAPWPRNPGDWIALASGLSWSLVSLKLYRMPPAPVPDLIAAFVAGCAAVTLAAFAVSGLPLPSLTLPALAWSLATAAYVLPMLALTLWPATVLSPARVGLLLMTEIVVGVVSAAAFAGDPFGLREALGSLLIVGAALAEIAAQPGPRRQSG